MHSLHALRLTRAEWMLLSGWAIGLILYFAVAGSWTVLAQHRSRVQAAQRHQARMDPAAADHGATPPDLGLPPGAEPTLVQAGIYVDRIIELSVKEGYWTVEFYLWFRWRGDAASPGDGFQVIDGSIESKDMETQCVHGDEHYERYRVVAKITKFFDVSRFPCDDHLLTINIENPRYQRHEMLFVADQENSSISSRVKVMAYEIGKLHAIEKPHSYKTTRGDPRLAPGAKTTYSQCRAGIGIRRSNWGLYCKLFQSLFVAVAIALLALFIKPTDVDPRFGLGVGGLFAAVANSYITSSLIPDTGIMTLADVVNGIGIAMVLLTVTQSAISLYLYDRKEAVALSRLFDKVSFVVVAAGYVALNVALPLSACC